MPTYDYRCRSCGHVTEVIHSMLEDGPSVCERCGGVLRRVQFPSGIIFKGSGFYRNDSRASTAGSESESPKAGSSSGSEATPGTTKTEVSEKPGKAEKSDTASATTGGSD